MEKDKDDAERSLLGRHRYWLDFVPRIFRGGRRAPLASWGQLKEFAATRSAFIAQKTLYGYVKTRMGVNFPNMFSDDLYIESVNIAKMRVYAACLSDLSLYAVACAYAEPGGDEQDLRARALECYAKGIADNIGAAGAEFQAEEAEGELRTRLASVDWLGTARTADIFSASPRALVDWAPIAEELKRYDKKFVRNSIRFAWRDVRRELERRLDREALRREALAQAISGGR